MESSSSLQRLSQVPFSEQCALIDEHLAHEQDVPVLLDGLTRLRDHEPLAYAVLALATLGSLVRPETAQALQRSFVELPDTGIQRVLAVADRTVLADSHVRVLVACAISAMRGLPLERLAVVCLIDRWLKNHAPDARTQEIARVEEEVLNCLQTSRVGDIRDEQLLLIPGARLDRIHTNIVNIVVQKQFGRRLAVFADRVLDILEQAPKSLSQANAEDILARRVYTDPGHFLFELLQNAEDSGARSFRVIFDERAVTVWHDGVAFDAKDVVGVLSIGQTTKRKDQIGFFGVGFKSVYEVCVRPRVYSGSFCFEIADVSIPRRIERPTDHMSGTRLVFLLRDPEDSVRSPAALFAKALAIPAQTLLTLSSLQHIEVRFGEQFRTMTVGPARVASSPYLDEKDATRSLREVVLSIHENLTIEPDADRRQDVKLFGERRYVHNYLIATDRFACDGMLRDSERVSSTRVLIGIALDSAGAPIPLERDAPTIFSFLPTREQSGVKFLIQAHFDLPVDRERLDLNSEWNRWAIACAGELLARVATALASPSNKTRIRAIQQFLDIVPLSSELAHSTYTAIILVLAQAAADTPFLLASNGALISPQQTAVADDRTLADTLAGVDVTVDGRRLLAHVHPSNEQSSRRERVALALGARRFTADDLVTLLERVTTSFADRDEPPVPWLVREHGKDILDALARAPAHAERTARLARLPVFADQHGRMHTAQLLARADIKLRRVYGDARLFLHPALDEQEPDTEHRLSTAQVALYRELGMQTLVAADLLSDLREPAIVRIIVSRDGGISLFDYLNSLSVDELGDLGALSIFPIQGTSDELRALVEPSSHHLEDIVWLYDADPFGEFISTMNDGRPYLISDEINRRFRGLLVHLGGRILDLTAFLSLLHRLSPFGRVVVGAVDHSTWVSEFHRALNTMRSDLSPRVIRLLVRAAVFPDTTGHLRPLSGEECVFVTQQPEDVELQALVPDGPWLDERAAPVAYVRGLGHRLVGAREVALSLAGAPTDMVLTLPVDDDDGLHRTYAYLSARVREIPADAIERLANAPIWLSETATRHPLTGMRLAATNDDLNRLYDGWGRFPRLESEADGISSLAFARALGLDRHVVAPDHQTLVRDLVVASYEDTSSLMPLFDDNWSVLVRCLQAAARELPRGKLKQLTMACIFRVEGGAAHERYPIIAWNESVQRAGVARANEPLRTALEVGSRRLLALDDEATLGAVLDVIGATPARLDDLINAVERDPAYAEPKALHRVRRVLVTLFRENTASVGELSDTQRARLSALALWPSAGGLMLPAGDIVRGRALGRLMTSWNIDDNLAESTALWRSTLGFDGADVAVLAEDSEDDAEIFASVVTFRDPMATLASGIDEIARIDRPLTEQPVLLTTPERVAELFVALRQHALANGDPDATWRRPLVVDAHGHLVRGRRHLADKRVLAFTRDLPMHADLADPEWARVIAERCPGLLYRSSIRQVLAALADAGRTPKRPVEYPHIRDIEARSALYAWLLEHRDAIEADEQARGALGRACIIISEQGYLRAPRSLLLDRELPDLDIDWNAGHEVPESLCRWLRTIYAVDDKRLDPLMAHLLDAHERAIRERDGARSADILRVMARSLRIGEIDDDSASALIKRFKLRKRLRVEDSRGAYKRPRTLLAPAPACWQSIAIFAEQLPMRVSSRYAEPRVRRLIQLAGAQVELDVDAIDAYLEGIERCCGLDADIALATYVAERAHKDRQLRQQLRLAVRAWIPDRRGEMRAPSDLYWPESDAMSVIGERSSRFPHTRFAYAVPADIQSWLPFRQLQDAAFSDVAAHIQTLADRGLPTPDEILAWMENGLRDGRVRAGQVRDALANRAFLMDDRGYLRTSDELLREDSSWYFGGRCGVFTAGQRFTRLASALRIAKHPGKREVLGVFERILDDLNRRGGAALLDEEPELIERLGRCLALLASIGGRMPATLPVPVEGTNGDIGVCPAPRPDDLYLRSPERLWHAAVAERAPILVPLLPDVSRESIDALLASLGVPDLTQVSEETLPAAGDYRAQLAREQLRAASPLSESSSSSEEASVESRQMRRQRERRQRREQTRRERQVRAQEQREAREQRLSEQRAHERQSMSTPETAIEERSGDRHDGDDEPARESERDETGLISRIRRWLSPRGDDERAPADDRRERHREPLEPEIGERSRQRRKAPERAYRSPSALRRGESNGGGVSLPDHSQWFRPRQRIGPQMGDNTAWAEDRQNMPVYGLALSPRSLPSPHVYAAQAIMDRFDPGTQRWMHTSLPREWSEPRAPGRFQVRLSGRLPAGEVVLPIPAYARVIDVSANPEGRLIRARNGTSILYLDRDSDVEYTVVLDRIPEFRATSGQTRPDELVALATHRARYLVASTVPDSELPEEVHEQLDHIQDSHERELPRALAVRDFIRRRYYYDPAYIEDPVVGRWLEGVSRGRHNAHIAAMHAGRDARYLGRGVCYELNSLACELLRRVGVPAAIASGWTMDRGHIDQPDHLWAVALLPTPSGPRFMPIDASSTRDGQPLHAGRRPPGPWRARPSQQTERPPRAPSWASEKIRDREGPSSESAVGSAMPLSDLMRVMRYLERITGENADSASTLRRRCRALLADPVSANRLLHELRAVNDRQSND